MPSVLLVCTGNLCRSPMAEGLLRARLARDEARHDWQVGSAGVWTVDGRSATPYGVAEMANRGIDIGGHQSRNITREMMADADLVLVMTRQHAEALGAAFSEHSRKVYFDVALDLRENEDAQTARELEQLVEEGYERIVALVERAPGD